MPIAFGLLGRETSELINRLLVFFETELLARVESNVDMEVDNEILEPTEESDDDDVETCAGCYLSQPSSVEYSSSECVRCSSCSTISHLVCSARTTEGDLSMECYGYYM